MQIIRNKNAWSYVVFPSRTLGHVVCVVYLSALSVSQAVRVQCRVVG
jgi:hypothetical protein